MNLEKYKNLLDYNTNDSMGIIDESKSRYYSFKLCLSHLNGISIPEVLELGTTRSFVGGAFEGCNSDDPKYWNPLDYSKWDFGAGIFTLIFGQTNCKLTTVDLIRQHIIRCKIMTDSLSINCKHIVSDSVNFLSNTNDKYDLIYLDTGDMWPINESQNLQLNECKVIIERGLLKDNGLLLIDDVLNCTPKKMGDINNIYGKSDLSIPYLESNKFIQVFSGYQVIMKRII